MLSIIIPTRNIPNLLLRCVESIPVRDDFEIIVVDDNSDSNIIENEYSRIANPNCKIIFDKSGKGAGHARNIGLSVAKGEWIIFADSDDFFYPTLGPFYDHYLGYSSDIIFFGVNSKDSDTLLPTLDYRAQELENLKIKACSSDNIGLLRWDNQDILNVPWGKMIKSNLIDKYKIRFDEVIAGNDAMFSMKAGLSAEHIDIDRNPIYCVTTRSGSLTQSVSKDIMKSRWNVACRINTYLFEINMPEMRYNLFVKQWRYMKYFPFEFLKAVLDVWNITPFRYYLKDFCEAQRIFITKIIKRW